MNELASIVTYSVVGVQCTNDSIGCLDGENHSSAASGILCHRSGSVNDNHNIFRFRCDRFYVPWPVGNNSRSDLDRGLSADGYWIQFTTSS